MKARLKQQASLFHTNQHLDAGQNNKNTTAYLACLLWLQHISEAELFLLVIKLSVRKQQVYLLNDASAHPSFTYTNFIL